MDDVKEEGNRKEVETLGAVEYYRIAKATNHQYIVSSLGPRNM